jgi:hypothetical protein
MKHGGHRNPATYAEFYAPNNSGVDGQATYWDGTPRTIVNDLFRSFTLQRRPHLCQSLPAEKKHGLERREDYVKIQKELEDLNQNPEKTEKECQSLYRQMKRLEKAELRKHQTEQRPNPPSSQEYGTYSAGSLRSRFARAGRMMPERKRLATNTFLVASLRSPIGRSVLNDMAALYKQDAELSVRPGLEPEKCHCPTAGESQVDRYVLFVQVLNR